MARGVNTLQDAANDPRRVGAVTASEAAEGLMKTKTGKFPSTRDAYALRLAKERVCGSKEKKWREDDDHESDLPRKPHQVRRGLALEPVALEMAEDRLGQRIWDEQFKLHELISFFGASPDGTIRLNSRRSLVEVKAQNSNYHTKTLLRGEIQEKYQFQMLVQLAVWDDYKEVLFLSINKENWPNEKQELAMVTFKPPRDRIKEVESDVIEFLREVKDIENQLREVK